MSTVGPPDLLAGLFTFVPVAIDAAYALDDHVPNNGAEAPAATFAVR